MSYKNFKELEIAYTKPYTDGEYKKALEMLEEGTRILPEEEYKKHEFVILLDKTIMNVMLKSYDEAVEIIKATMDMGYLFPLHYRVLEPIRQLEEYIELKQKNDKLLEKAQSAARAKYDVQLPDSCCKEKKHPLMLLLHGDGGDGNIEDLKYYWKPEVLFERGFIVAYLQSSQVLCHNGYGWLPNAEVSRRDIKDCYDKIVEEYTVDESMVFIGGFSGGAIASMDIALSNAVPVKGFLSLCPSRIPAAYTDENIRAAVQRGVRGVMLEGEDAKEDIEVEKQILKGFEAEGLRCKYIINKEVGHWYPKDFDAKQEEALEFLLEK
ncbi:MAG: alpha/beta hydrolase [Bacillota bacterium]